jgi:hypothetical protein
MSLMIITLVILMTGIMTDRGGSFMPYMAAMNQRQKARNLAYGGIALAQSQLGRIVTGEQDKKSESKKPTKPTAEQEDIELLKVILPILNQWQTVVLTMERDGIDGKIELCICSEDGKININEWFDFKEKKFKDEKKGEHSFKALLTTLLAPVEKRMQAKELVPALEQFLAKRGYQLNDVTELLTIKAFEPFRNAQWYTPTTTQKEEAGPVYALADIFTTHTQHKDIEPWLFSSALCGMYGINRIHTIQGTPGATQKGTAETERISELLKQFKQKADWKSDWDNRLKNIYTVQFAQLPKYASEVLSNTFQARIFSVIVAATVGDVTQRLYVILERIKKSQDTKTVYDVIVRAFYWI